MNKDMRGMGRGEVSQRMLYEGGGRGRGGESGGRGICVEHINKHTTVY